MALSKTTQDHDEIRQWAEARGGKPAEVASTESNGQTGIIRLEFPGAVNANDSALKEIAWEEFFAKFDASGLALVYQEQTAEGATSNFNKLIHPENASSSAKKAAKKAPANRTPAKKAPVKKGAAPSSTSSAAKMVSAGKKASVPAKKNAKTAPAKSTAASKKSAATKKAVPAKKTVVAKVPAKKISAKTSPPKKTQAKKTVPAKKATKR